MLAYPFNGGEAGPRNRNSADPAIGESGGLFATECRYSA